MKVDRVSEPVQVYLAAPDRERLDWLTDQLGVSKSDVLRRALVALEQAVADPEAHPLLRVSGIGRGEGGPGVDYDPALEHDRYLAEANWAVRESERRPTPRRGRAR